MSEPSGAVTGRADAVDEPTQAAEAGSAAKAAPSVDYRDELGSRRWDAAPLRNPEAEKTKPWIAVVVILLLAAVTLAVLVVGYYSGLWTLPDREAASGAVAALELLA